MLQFCDYKTGKKANLEILHIHMQSKDEPTICEHFDPTQNLDFLIT